MYTFEDRLNGDSLTLRPEATAGIVRAAIEHNLTYERPQRVWTTGPMFRHERPQKGRYRQFHQFDVEALGFAGPDVDAEQIVMLQPAVAQCSASTASSCTSIRSAMPTSAARIAPRWSSISARTRPSSTRTRSVACTPIRCAFSTARIRRCRRSSRARRDSSTASGAASRAHFDGLQQLLTDHGIALHDRSAPGARPRLLQPHRVRMDDRSPRRAGHRRRRRPLRRPVRATRRQADAGVRLRASASSA